MSMEGMPSNLSEQPEKSKDPLAHLLEESGMEDTTENRQEAEQVKAAFIAAREKDANLDPEAKEKIEDKIVAKQEEVLESVARSGEKVARIEQHQGKQEELNALVAQAKKKIGLYGFLMEASTVSGVSVVGPLLGIEAIQGIPEEWKGLLYGVGAAFVVGSISFKVLKNKWEDKKSQATRRGATKF